MRVEQTGHQPIPSVAALLRVADFALLRQDAEQAETLIELVYQYFDSTPKMDD